MLKVFRLLSLLAALLCLTGCQSFRELLDEALDPEANVSDNPNSENFKPRYAVGIFTIVKYPRAGELEKEVEGLDGRTVWINTNQNFSSKYIKDVVVVPRPGDPDICDLRMKLDRLGKLQWQILAGMHIGKPVAFIVDGMYFGSFYPEAPRSEKADWVEIRIGINPVTAKGIAKFAKKNYTYYNPSTQSWF